MSRDLSPWARHALASIRGAGPLGTSLYNIAHEMKRRLRDLDDPLRVLVAQGLVIRSEDGRYTAVSKDDGHDALSCKTPEACGTCHVCQRPKPCAIHRGAL